MSTATTAFVRESREGDVLTASATEQTLAGKTGIYDVNVSNQDGRTIALFRGKSHRISGEVISGDNRWSNACPSHPTWNR